MEEPSSDCTINRCVMRYSALNVWVFGILPTVIVKNGSFFEAFDGGFVRTRESGRGIKGSPL